MNMENDLKARETRILRQRIFAKIGEFEFKEALSYGTAGKNQSSRVFQKRDQIFDQYKTDDFKD